MKVQFYCDPICGIRQEPDVSVFGKVEQKSSPERVLIFKTKEQYDGWLPDTSLLKGHCN